MIDPSNSGRFGNFGGMFVPETLIPACQELEKSFREAWGSGDFREELNTLLKDYAGRPSPVTVCERLSEELGYKVLLKREDLNHTGSHKINNVLGQALLAKRMGKSRLVAETGAGQHGVATATAAALFGMECVVYMGEVDIERQKLNVFSMKLLGAEVRPALSGSRTLKDAINEAMRDWVSYIDNTHYIIGSVAGPHPYPMIVRDFNSIVGTELKKQSKILFGRYPDKIVACVGGGSNAMGIFYPFIKDKEVDLIGVEAAGSGLSSGKHAAPLSDGSPGVLHGMKTYLMQNADGQILGTHSVSAGLDYPGVGPEHSFLKDMGRVHYEAATDKEALKAFHDLSRVEGIMPALETSHALAWVSKNAKKLKKSDIVVVNLSGRGDKDMQSVAKADGINF